MIIFETPRLLVRPYTEDDDENFFRLNGDPEVVKYIRPAKNREECAAFLREIIAQYLERPLYGRWAVETRDAAKEFVGSFALIPVGNTTHIQLGYALLPPAWGFGYATELTFEGLRYGFEKTPLDIIYAYTEMPHTASQKVLLKAGFREGENRFEEGKELRGFLYPKTAFIEKYVH